MTDADPRIDSLQQEIAALQQIVAQMAAQSLVSETETADVGEADVSNWFGPSQTAIPRPFEIVDYEDGMVVMDNCYFRIGGRTYEMTQKKASAAGLLCIAIDAREAEMSATYVNLTDADELIAQGSDLTQYYLPLYQFDSDGVPTCDWRGTTTAAMGEFS